MQLTVYTNEYEILIYRYTKRVRPRSTGTQSIPTTHIVYVTSTLQPVYFNNFTGIHFIIPLFGIITKL